MSSFSINSTKDPSLFAVRQGDFEGPLELLLSLIEERKLLINEFSLSAVTDDFVNYTKSNETTLGQSAQFIVVAASLILIKSKSLLPTLILSDEESVDIASLEERLAILRDVGLKATALSTLLAGHTLWERGRSERDEVIFAPPATLLNANGINLIAESARNLIGRLAGAKIGAPKVAVRKIISLESVILDLMSRVEEGLKVSFHQFTKKGGQSFIPREERSGIIVSFLALLELVKRGRVAARQDIQYGDIAMHANQVSTPRYI